MKISSSIKIHDTVFPSVTDQVLKNEPMLFNCDLTGAYEKGGVITERILNALPKDWRDDVVIDTRVHMLMPGWYPCIPGWHHDDVPRTREDGQPNYNEGQDRSEHMIVLLNGDICPTKFAIGESNHSVPPLGSKLYKVWNDEVDILVKNKLLESVSAPSNRFVEFNDRTWHTGTAAIDSGWRYFFRISRYYDAVGNRIARRNKRTNEVRKQVQVYMDSLTEGW